MKSIIKVGLVASALSTAALLGTFPAQAQGFSLNPEQQIGAECLSTFGASKAGLACIAGELTIRELDKCQYGIGVHGGCLGPNNEIVRHGSNALRDLNEGPGPNNDLFGENGAAARVFGAPLEWPFR